MNQPQNTESGRNKVEEKHRNKLMRSILSFGCDKSDHDSRFFFLSIIFLLFRWYCTQTHSFSHLPRVKLTMSVSGKIRFDYKCDANNPDIFVRFIYLHHTAVLISCKCVTQTKPMMPMLMSTKNGKKEAKTNAKTVSPTNSLKNQGNLFGKKEKVLITCLSNWCNTLC